VTERPVFNAAGETGKALVRPAALAAWPAGAAFATQPSQRLLIAAYPSVDKIIKAALPAFKAMHPGVDVTLVSRQFDDHHTAMTTALTTASNLPDVMALEVDYLGRFARGIGLEDLSRPPYNVLQHRDRFVPYAFDQAMDRTGAVLAVPTDIGPGTLLYRADLLAKAGVSEAEFTATWDGYVAAGAKVRAATGARLLPHARDIKDIVLRSGLQTGEGLFFDRGGRALADTPRFHRAFELALKVRQQQLDAKGVPWSSDWAEGLKRGGIASLMIGAWMAGHLNGWLAPNTRGQWRTAQLPEGAYAASGGTFFAIPRRAEATRKRAAWDFIRLMTRSPPCSKPSTTRSSSNRSTSWAARPGAWCGAKPHAASKPCRCTSRTALPARWSTPNSTRCSTAASALPRRWPTRSG
jgi:multiple sugar transport system substrate-binding protein